MCLRLPLVKRQTKNILLLKYHAWHIYFSHPSKISGP